MTIGPQLRIRTTAPNRTRQAFTLIEITVVLLTLGVIACAALPRFSYSISIARADSAARRLANDINAARGMARLTSQSVSVVFDTGTNTYTLNGVPNPDRPSIASTIVSLTDSLMSATLASVNLTGGGSSIAFNGFGFPSKGGTITITSGGASKQVLVDAATGMATVP